MNYISTIVSPFKAVVLLIIVSINSSTLNASHTITIDTTYFKELNSSWIDIEYSFLLFDNNTDIETFEEIRAPQYQSSFKPLENQFVDLDDTKASWIKTYIKNELQVPINLALWIQCSNADVYISNSGDYKHKMAGDFYPKSKWDSEIHYPDIPDPYTVTVSLEPDERKEIYIKIGPYIYHPVANLRLSTYDHSFKNLSSLYSNRNLIQGICMGMFLIMLFYNLFIYITYRDKVYLLNTFYIFCLAFWFLVTFKLDKLIFLGEYPVITELLYNPVGYGIGTFYILFVRAMIGPQNFSPLLNKLINYYMFLIVLAIIVSNTIIFLSTYYNLTSFALMKIVFPPIGIIGVLISIYFIYYMFRLGTKLTNILAISSCFVLLGASIAIFEDIVKLSGITSYYSQYAGFSYNLLIETTFLLQLVLFGLALGIRARAMEYEKNKLEEIDKIKTNFFTNISHEIRTPLTLLLSPVKQVLSESKNKNHVDLLQTAYRSGNRLLNLLNQILDLSKIDARSMALNISDINIVSLLKECTMMFESRASERNIKCTINSNSEDIFLYLDRDKTEKIVYNLISNAIKFNKENGSVDITVVEEKADVSISISDSGIGIDKSELDHVFDRFYQAGSGSKSGSGIGLALVKELVELHSGNITVESDINKGSTFTLIFKKGKTHLENVKIDKQSEDLHQHIHETEPTEAFSEESVINISADGDSPIILIIEDHPELHSYIKKFLISNYQVFSAYDGLTGIQKAINIIPDLIISDVMMPGKDGYEVCEMLKTDERTSHIPIILLTAKADIDSKIYGLETGADDYIAKPFDNKELAVRIQNIITQRSRLREKFKSEVNFIPEKISSNTTDKQFMRRIIEIINDNLSKESFGIDEMTREIGMSRTQLNRKLRDLVDQSSNKFIQSCRLNKALELLKTSGHNISDIAHLTGFRSDAYFVKCFKEQFGTTPGKYFEKEK